MEQHKAVADLMAHLGRRLEATSEADPALPVIVRMATELIPGIDQASITLSHRRGQLETVAAFEGQATEFDQFQYEEREGPCLAVLDPTIAPVLVTTDVPHEQRWPSYIRRAAQAGLTGQVAARISTGGGLRASLNLYRTGSEDMTEQTLRLAELFAVQAGLALNRAHTEANLRLALTTRHTIGQAIGIVRERFGLTEDQAIAYLTRISQHTNTKLRDVAAEITTSVDDHSESG